MFVSHARGCKPQASVGNQLLHALAPSLGPEVPVANPREGVSDLSASNELRRELFHLFSPSSSCRLCFCLFKIKIH